MEQGSQEGKMLMKIFMWSCPKEATYQWVEEQVGREKKVIVAVDKCFDKCYLERRKRERIVPGDGIGS